MTDSRSRSHSITSFRGGHSTTSELQLCSSVAETPHIAKGSNFGGVAAGSSSARYKLMSPAKLPISRSPCITVPPGLSPTSFLESPVLLSNMMAEPSPTTGSFMNPQQWHDSGPGFSLAAKVSCADTVDKMKNDCFEFKLHNGPSSVSGFPPVAPMKFSGTDNLRSESFHCQPFASANYIKSEMESRTLESSLPDPVHPSAIVHDGVDSEEMNHGMTLTTGVQASQADHKDNGHSVVAVCKSADDGYNWRKYGQKLVKGSEFPRSYYKCAHPNCEVKKIFERSYEGKITEIVYKGTHDHPKPHPARRFTAGAIMPVQELTDSPLNPREDKSAMYARNSHNMEPSGTPKASPNGANDNNLEGSTPQVNGHNDEGDDDDPFLKRRKLDEMSIDVTPVVKPIREPRVVVQTVSEVDILDDGYRWRKYGQKVVRGNPNPRSYYKCTNAGCPVRKHVERASHDPKAVITTYEGKHNHDVPTARHSSHDMAGPGPGHGSRPGPMNTNPMSIVRPDGNDSISLDLGVGISSVSENRPNERQQKLDPGPLSIHNVVQLSPMSTFYGFVNGASSYVSRENHTAGHNFQTPTIDHSPNLYPQNLEGVPLGS